MLCGVCKVHDIRNYEGDCASKEYLLVHAEVVCHSATDKNSCADTDIPTAEIGAVRCAALVVAGEVHAHGLVTGEDKPEACADEECGQEECNGTVAKSEDKVSDDIQRHAGADEVNQVTAVNQAAGHNAVHDETACNERIKPACTADAKFICINSDIVGDGAVSKSDEDEVCKLRNGSREEKAVERKRCVLFLFAGLYLKRLHEHKPDNAKCGGNGENDSVAECFVEKHTGHGTGGEGQIHTDPEITDAFASATRGQCINSHSITSSTRNAKEQSVCKTHNCKDWQ